MKSFSSPSRPMGRASLIQPAQVVIRPSKTLTIRRQRLTAPKMSVITRRSGS